MNGRFADNPNYRELERLTVRLHDLIAAGEGDSDEADAVRDLMDGPWRRIGADEVKRLNGLSGDLYMLSDDEVFEDAPASTRGPDTLGAALITARAQGNWEQVLSLLRAGPTFLSPRQVASFRTEAYDELGHADVARRFAQCAARLNADEVRRAIVHV